MPRIARIVFAGVPHHITQRGNRRVDVFRTDEDRRRYLGSWGTLPGVVGDATRISPFPRQGRRQEATAGPGPQGKAVALVESFTLHSARSLPA